MAKAPNLTDLTSQYSAQATINGNNQKVEDAFQNTVSRDGSTPNQMEADFDMNGYDILNVSTIDTSTIKVGGNVVSVENVYDYKAYYATKADAISETNLTVGNSISIGGLLYLLVTSGTYTEDGEAVINLSGSNTQAVLAPKEPLPNLTSLENDTRPPSYFSEGQYLRLIKEGDTYVKADTDEDVETEGGAKWKLVARSFDILRKTVPLDVRDFGVFGNDNEGSLVDETAGLQAAFEASATQGRELNIHGTNYLAGGLLIDEPRYPRLIGTGNRPIIHGTQALADAGGTLCEFTKDFDIGSGTLAITADIIPNEKLITLNDVSGLSIGMVLQFASDVLWYHDDRDQWYKGEYHKISRILSGTNQVEVEGATWDAYDISAETLTVRAFWPVKDMLVQNIAFKMPLPAVETSTAGLTYEKALGAKVDGCRAEGMTSSGFKTQRSFDCRFRDIEVEDIGRGAETDLGYGISVQSSVRTKVEGITGRSLRRLVDFTSFSGTTSAPCRLGLVRDFKAYGGGVKHYSDEYFPLGTQPNFGVGTHGSAEYIKFLDGFVTGVDVGIIARSRNTTIRGVDFYGHLDACIQGSYGTGLDISDCTYNKNDYPNKVDDAGLNEDQDRQANTFLRLGGKTNFGSWDFNLATTVRGVTANGLYESFIQFAATGPVVENLYVSDIALLSRAGGGGTFYVFDAPNGAIDIANSQIDIEPSRLKGNNDYRIFRDNIVVGFDVGLDSPVKLNGKFVMNIPDDDVHRVRNANPLGDRMTASFLCPEDAGVRFMGVVYPESSTNLNYGNAGGSIEFLATEPDGTTGTDGVVSVYLSDTGDLFVENRLGSTAQIVMSLL